MRAERRYGEAGERGKGAVQRAIPEYLRNGMAGATSGAVARGLTAPFDVAKIRFQLDHAAASRYKTGLWEALHSIYAEEGVVSLWRYYGKLGDVLQAAVGYSYMPGFMRLKCKTVAGRGNVPAMFMWTTFAAVQFATYEQLRKADLLGPESPVSALAHGDDEAGAEATRNNSFGATAVGDKTRLGDAIQHRSSARRDPPSSANNFVYGAIAGCTAAVVSYPFDITRTALAYQGVPKRYPSIFAFLRHTVREAGPAGLFRGVTPALAMIAPQMGVGFAVYELVKECCPVGWARTPLSTSAGRSATLAAPAAAAPRIDSQAVAKTSEERHRVQPQPDGSMERTWPLVAGAVAGMTSKLAVFPLDTVKKRVQTQVMLQRNTSYGVLPKYAGPIHALRTILAEEGLLALFRGSVPAMWKSGLSSALTFAVYEWTKTAMDVI